MKNTAGRRGLVGHGVLFLNKGKEFKKEVPGKEEHKYGHVKKATSLLYLLSGTEDDLKCLIQTFSPRASVSAFAAWRCANSGRSYLNIMPSGTENSKVCFTINSSKPVSCYHLACSFVHLHLQNSVWDIESIVNAC